jgi:hypothetical protein
VPDQLFPTVQHRAAVSDTYRQHAAAQSMDYYLRDWRKAHDLLGRRIAELEAMHRERVAETEAGAWPPTR